MNNNTSDLRNFVAFYSVYNGSAYEDYEKIVHDNLSFEEKKTAVNKLIEDKIIQLKTLLDQVNKISNLIGSRLTNDLRVCINSNINLLEAMGSELGNLKDEADIEAALEHFTSSYKNSSNELEGYISQADKSFHDALYYAVRYKVATIEELENFRQMDGLSDDEIKMIDDTIRQLKEDGVVEEGQKNAEQTAVEDEKGKESETIDLPPQETVVEETVQDSASEENTKPLTLEERINQIQYQPGVNYGDQVSEVRIAFEIEQLSPQIEALTKKKEEKGKLTFKDAVLLQSLITRVAELEQMSFELQHKDMKREEQMTKTNEKMDDTSKGITTEQEKREQYQSKLFKYVSSRKEQKLQAKLEKLRSKMAVIQDSQRKSVLVEFDKLNQKLIKTSMKKAKKQVRKERLDEKIEQLRALKDSVVKEVQNIRSDAKLRRVPTPQLEERVERMRQKPVQLLGASNVIYLPAPVEEEALQMAA